jgi:uncharacterized protein YdhG (YjbR/CyaY superfamily)
MKSSKPTNFEAYASAFPGEVQERLRRAREIILKAAPEAVEHISYGMPAFKVQGRPLVYVAGYKSHIGFYAIPNTHEKFSEELSGYKQGKGSVQFPHSQPLPAGLIGRMVAYRLQTLLQQKK